MRKELADYSQSKVLQTYPSIYYERIAYENLENLYFTHPFATNGVNHYLNELASVGWHLESDHPKGAEYSDEFLHNCTLDPEDLLEFIRSQLLIGGNCFIELVPNRGKNKIVDLRIIDPNSIDYQRNDTEKTIKLDDKTMLPVGFCQKGLYCKEQKFTYEEVAHARLYKLSNTLLGMGILEPSYETFEDLKEGQRGLAEAIYRHGYPNWEIIVGKPERDATAEEIKAADAIAEDIVAGQDVFKHDHNMIIKKIESNNIKSLKDNLDHFLDLISASLGVDQHTLTGKGDSSNRAVQQEFSKKQEKNVRAVQSSINSVFQHQIFKRMLKKNHGIDANVWFVWDESKAEDKSLQAERIHKYTQVGMLTYTPETEEQIREIEGLPALNKEDKKDDTEIIDVEATVDEELDDKTLQRKDEYSSVDDTLASYLRSLKGRFGRLRNALTRRVVSDKARFKEILQNEIDDLNNEVLDSVNHYLPLAFDTGFRVGKRELASKEDIIKHLTTLNIQYITELSATVQDQILKSISDGIDARESLDELKARIKNLFETDLEVKRKAHKRTMPDGTVREIKATTMKIPILQRLQMIATEEVRESFRQSKLNYYIEERPDIPSMEWRSRQDEKVCLDCKELHGKTFPVNHVPDRPHPNCRCGLAASEDDPEDPTKVKLPITKKPKFERQVK
jgi:SPP1 gp7 family putative phage head morphogenesis protein